MAAIRLRAVRETKQDSKESIERQPGIRKCIPTRLENHQTVETGETIEMLAEALGLSLDRFSNQDGEYPSFPNLPNRLSCDDIVGTDE